MLISLTVVVETLGLLLYLVGALLFFGWCFAITWLELCYYLVGALLLLGWSFAITARASGTVLDYLTGW
jgi:hypothetical protein